MRIHAVFFFVWVCVHGVFVLDVCARCMCVCAGCACVCVQGMFVYT